MKQDKPRIAILGAGPVGLEAALAAAEGGYPFTVYEAAPHVGGSVRQWGHVRLFTPWVMNVSERMHRHLESTGWEPPANEELPTGDELATRLLEPVAALPAVRPALALGTRVLAVSRQGLLKNEAIGRPERAARPFRLLLRDADGAERIEPADVVLDCTGTWERPNSLGDGGIPAPGEARAADRIRRDIPDFASEAAEWAGRTVLLAGAGHSAQTAALALAEFARNAPGTRVVWAVRHEEPTWQAVPDDPLPERARLTDRARELAAGASDAVELVRGAAVEALASGNGAVEVVLRRGEGGPTTVPADRILSLTGAVGDHLLYRQLQVHECWATAGPMKLAAALIGQGSVDCLAQTTHGAETLTSPEPNFFLLGIKSYGKSPNFLMRVGYEQVGEVFGALPPRICRMDDGSLP